MSEENYFRFPLAILQGIDENGKPCNSKPFEIIDDALSYGVVNAGVGLIKTQGQEVYDEMLEEEEEKTSFENLSYHAEAALVGASMCGVRMASSKNLENAGKVYHRYDNHKFPLVTIKAEIFWAAFHQARYEDNKGDLPARGISWREFRILCAILSVKKNRDGFSFVGWQEIQARSCGMLRADFKTIGKIPCHLATPYSQKQITRTCEKLEALKFFVRYRHSKGKRGGFMAYSFKHSPEDLRKAVGRWASFRRGDSIRQNRAADLAYALKNQ